MKTNTKRNHSSKKRKLFVTIIICLFVILMFFFSDYGVIKRISLEMKSNELQKEISVQNQISDSLQTIINKLQKDTFEIEKIAREKYGMTKPNEEVYYLKKRKK